QWKMTAPRSIARCWSKLLLPSPSAFGAVSLRRLPPERTNRPHSARRWRVDSRLALYYKTPMRAVSKQRYLPGSRPREQRRLSRLNELMNQACLRELALAEGDSVLDVGSGLGQFTRDMARAAGPRARVLGVERDPQQIRQARQKAEEAGEVDL